MARRHQRDLPALRFGRLSSAALRPRSAARAVPCACPLRRASYAPTRKQRKRGSVLSNGRKKKSIMLAVLMRAVSAPAHQRVTARVLLAFGRFRTGYFLPASIQPSGLA